MSLDADPDEPEDWVDGLLGRVLFAALVHLGAIGIAIWQFASLGGRCWSMDGGDCEVAFSFSLYVWGLLPAAAFVGLVSAVAVSRSALDQRRRSSMWRRCGIGLLILLVTGVPAAVTGRAGYDSAVLATVIAAVVVLLPLSAVLQQFGDESS